MTSSHGFTAASLRSLVGAIGLTIALSIALAFPLIFAVHQYIDEANFLEFKAHLSADRLAKYIYSHERLWEYQQQRLGEVILLPQSGESVRQRIRNAEGRVVLEEETDLRPPLLTRGTPIVVKGARVGVIEVEKSLVSFLAELGFTTLLSFLLGGGAYFALRVLPLRILDRTVGELETQNFRFAAALDNMSHGLTMFDGEQRLVVSNQRYRELYGLPPELTRPGTPLLKIAEYRASQEARAPETPEDYMRNLVSFSTEDYARTSVFELKDGRFVAATRNPMPGGGWVAAHEDVTEQRQAAARIAYLVHHDALTHLPNRLLLQERLSEELQHAAPGQSLAVLCLGLDRFKEINDTLGHRLGDALLKQAAERVQACIRETDIAARVGGDEFTVVQIGRRQPAASTSLASRLIEKLGAPYEIDGHQVAVGASIGVAIAPQDGTDADRLIRSADIAMHRAKADGRGTYRFFEADMNNRMQARRQLEIDLRKALTNREFELHYQPLLSLDNDEITGFEALLRWNHPERGRVSPADFIPLAEETGIIVSMGEWVLRQACTDAVSWPEHIKVAVNLSPVQFKGHGLVLSVFSALSTSGLAPNRLELEITESVLMEDTDAALAMLHQLRSLGVSIAMDDFGTGYSSLSYLQRFPFDKIKVDRSFVMGLGHNTSSIAVLRAVASLGTSLSVLTTAEGVETEQQLTAVRAEGISQIQGYLVSPPRPASEIAKFFGADARQGKGAPSAA